MFIVLWLALAVYAAYWTHLWLIPRRDPWGDPERITVATTVSAALWSVFALSGSGAFWITESGIEVVVEVETLQYVATGLALLALLALAMHRLGLYPPDREGLE